MTTNYERRREDVRAAWVASRRERGLETDPYAPTLDRYHAETSGRGYGPMPRVAHVSVFDEHGSGYPLNCDSPAFGEGAKSWVHAGDREYEAADAEALAEAHRMIARFGEDGVEPFDVIVTKTVAVRVRLDAFCWSEAELLAARRAAAGLYDEALEEHGVVVSSGSYRIGRPSTSDAEAWERVEAADPIEVPLEAGAAEPVGGHG